jgi:hypothetical protein
MPQLQSSAPRAVLTADLLDELSPLQRAVLDHLLRRGPRTARQVHEALGVHTPAGLVGGIESALHAAVRNALEKLRGVGALVHAGDCEGEPSYAPSARMRRVAAGLQKKT